jgi:signal transduction histidine kinase
VSSASAEVSAPVRPARWPSVFLAGFLAIALIAEWVSVLGGQGWRDDVVFIILFFGYGLVGALIVSRMPTNRIGWLLMFVSGMSALSFLADVTRLYRIDQGSNGTTEGWLSMVAEAGWIVALVPGLLLLLQLFPDGRPVGRWGRWLTGVTLAFVGFSFLAVASAPTFGTDLESPNPVHVTALEPLNRIGEAVVFPGFIVLLVVSFVALAIRYRRSSGQERQQIRWMAFAAPVMVSGFVIAQFLTGYGVSSFVTDLIVACSLGTLPLAIGVAILRYRLWDLDLVVRKTVLAAFVVVILMAVFGLLTLLARSAVDAEGDADLFIAAAVGFAVWPAFRLARRLADRVVYGGRATPYEVLAGFADQVGATYADEDVLIRMVTAVGEGIGAERADLWLDREGRPLLAATWPADAPAGEAVQADDDRSAVFPIEFHGEPLGRLGARKAPGERMSGRDHELMANLAAQSGPLLHNASLTDELKVRLEDLRTAQRRLVTAQDEERRRLERNIHDGAQQQLVALAVKARLARTLAERDLAKAAEMLGQMESETQTALEDLRDLARGIYPPLLADQGLVAAIEAQARRAAIPVAVHAPERFGRFPAEVEAAVYFSCLEALQNVTKYAQADHVSIELSNGDGAVRFSVVDDGRGFDPAATQGGSGLQGMADRLGALGGDLIVTSALGAGTTIAGEVPV